MSTRKAITACFLVFGITLLGVTWPPAALAQETEDWLVSDRPGFYWGAPTVPKGHMQLEAGYAVQNLDSSQLQSLGQVLFRVGLSPRTELRIGTGSYDQLETEDDSASGFEDGSLGAKFHLVEGNLGHGLDRPDFSLQATVFLPTGSEFLRREKVQPELLGIAAWNLSSPLTLVTNLGYSMSTIDGERNGYWFGSAALEFALPARTGGFLEFYTLEPSRSDQIDRQTYVDVSFNWRVVRLVQIDAHIGYGLNGLDDDFFYGVGITYGR